MKAFFKRTVQGAFCSVYPLLGIRITSYARVDFTGEQAFMVDSIIIK